MKKIRHSAAFLVFLTLSTTASQGALSDGRLALGDESQDRRTTSVNWPRSSRPIYAHAVVAKAPASEPVLAPPPPPATVPPPKLFRVLVDVGHGGHDFGAPGPNGVLEKEICLRIASQVKERLERASKLADFAMEVRLSRESDHFISLRERVKEANNWGADLFVSIHANSSLVPRARGFEVYFLSNEATDADATRIARQENGENAPQALSKGVLSILSDLKNNTHILESSRFAEVVYSALSERLRPNGKGVRQAPFTVLSGTQMPALLIEVGYLTNAEEASALSKVGYQNRIAGSLADGVLDFALRMRRLSKAGLFRLVNRRTT